MFPVFNIEKEEKKNPAWSQTESPCMLNVKCRSTDMFSMSCMVWGMQSVSEGDLINTDIAMWLLCIYVCACVFVCVCYSTPSAVPVGNEVLKSSAKSPQEMCESLTAS